MRTRGFTTIELVVSSVITGVVMAATAQVLLASQDALVITAMESELSSQCLGVCDRIANDLKDAEITSVSISDVNGRTKNKISFQKCLGYASTGMIVDSNTTSYYEATDSTTGLTCVVREYTFAAGGSEREYITAKLSPNGLKFTQSTTTPPDSYSVSVRLRKEVLLRIAKKLDLLDQGDLTDKYFSISRDTSVQLKNTK